MMGQAKQDSTCTPIPRRGVKFGRLTVLRLEGIKKGRKQWRCLCECGRHKLVTTRLLTTSTTRSCGCLHIDSAREIIATNRKAA